MRRNLLVKSSIRERVVEKKHLSAVFVISCSVKSTITQLTQHKQRFIVRKANYGSRSKALPYFRVVLVLAESTESKNQFIDF